MNIYAVLHILGWVLKFEALFLSLPCIVAVVYREKSGFAFLITLLICLGLGFLLQGFKNKSEQFYAKEGFTSVALSWIILSFFGSLPFVISGEIPSFTDALFETVSGFTTTGASILSDVEALSHCCLFWRSFTHWIGGMGVLVFILAVLPLTGGYNMHLLRAESPGPQVGKLVPRMKSTAKILYGIYIVITIIEIVLLLFGGIPLFDALTTTFGTVGTGGFGIKNSSIGGYSSYVQIIVTIFMIMSGINFNLYYLVLIKKPLQALKSEELRYYLGFICVSAAVIILNTYGLYDSLSEAVRHSFFQVASIITTTGYATIDYKAWPQLSQTILVFLMFIGASAGSTGGGIKVSRVLILLKSAKREILAFIHPRNVKQTRIEGRTISPEVRSSVSAFLIAYLMVFGVSLLVISIDNFSFETNFTAIAATLNNIGPGLGIIGPTGNYSSFSLLSKYTLIFDMLAGRLEIFPMLVLFAPMTWKR